ncbi:hypothetical protein [Halarcobacter anaerophilus]|jgi:hypothetical protein|uniref:Uncharacterized protein n=1 Tax=Halarcobacter anaerophilus TaxID=877500 RepID=A0A4Q0XWX4_9BACT|nr:hypothetical protein [Halarcobacter anaerophilus]QDF28255.1 hypothetical protein AANAER_0761 [Halarcobacter anaerophilus]RXJ62077.1 hypothetical protein CRV06_11640 [Halarcobacter anaerophilus]
MGRGARDSLVVNNFFTFASIVIITITLTLYTKYIRNDSDKLKIKELQCQKQSYTKVTLFNHKLLKKSIKALNKGYYKVEGAYLKSQINKSIIEDVISLEEIEKYYETLIGVEPKKEIEKFLKIRFELVENDKSDKESKEKERFKAGTLITSFRINSKELLRFESDFKFMYKNAIKQRVDCSMKVYKNYVKN